MDKRIDYPVPFFANTPDDTHCFQAAIKMVLSYFQPGRNYSWEELDVLSAKREDLWSWPYATNVWLSKQGFDVVSIDPFDNVAFVNEGGDYLIREYGEEVGRAQIAHSDIAQEQRLASEFLQCIDVQLRTPNQQDLVQLLEQGYLVICNVNSHALDGKDGYSGHSVLVKGFTSEAFILHDPGLPAHEQRLIPFDVFEKAWAYPHEKAKNILAVKLDS